MYLRFEVSVEVDGAFAAEAIDRRIRAALLFEEGSTIALMGPKPKVFTVGLVQKGE